MPWVAWTRRPTLPSNERQRGFTLIEALVSLVLLGLLAGLVFPSMNRWYSAIVARQEVAELSIQIKQLPARAVLSARDLSLADFAEPAAAADGPQRLALPKGWRVVDSGDLRFLRSGLCQPGQARMASDSGQAAVFSANGLCEIQVALQTQASPASP